MAAPGSLFAIPERKLLIRSLLAWYRKKRRDLPWRRERDPYHVWLSEIMLQQTRVETVLPYFERFLEKYPRLEDLAQAEEQEVLAAWSGLGYYNRARNLRRAAGIVCDKYHGRFPTRYEEAVALPGIGRYTAGAILSIAYELPYPILDGNIRRLLARILALQEPADQLDRQLWPLLSSLVQEPEAGSQVADFNQSLMELGALVCLPRNPLCPDCPVRLQCRAHQLGLEEVLPRRKAVRSSEELDFTVAAIEQDGRWLFCSGHGDGFLQGFWEMPRVPGAPGPGMEDAFLSRHGLDLQPVESFPPIRHQITHRKLRYYPFRFQLRSPLQGPDWRWVRPEDSALPVASYTKKILRRVLEPCHQQSFRYNSADETG